MALIEYDGLVIDDSTGEIIDGDTTLDALAHRAYEAEQQRREWERIEAACKAALLAKQDSHRAAYGRIVATVITGSYPLHDAKRWQRDINEGAIPPELTRDLLLYANRFDRKAMPAALSGLVENYTNHVPRKPYVQLTPARRRAPMPTGETEE